MDPPPDLRFVSCFHPHCEGGPPHLWPPLTHLRPHAGNRRMPGSSVCPGPCCTPGLPATTKLMVRIPPQLTPDPCPDPSGPPCVGRGNEPFVGWLFSALFKVRQQNTVGKSSCSLLKNVALTACCSHLHANQHAQKEVKKMFLRHFDLFFSV